jgi:hypothetical protein
MAFYLPVFNLSLNDWYLSQSSTDTPTVYLGNMSSGRRTCLLDNGQPLDFNSALAQWLLTPSTSEIGTLTTNNVNPDVVECPAGSALYYLVALPLTSSTSLPSV